MILIGLFMALLAGGMTLGGFYLLEYLVTGELVTVPHLYGKDKTEAIEILLQNGFVPSWTEDTQFRSDIEAGLVVQQRPGPGEEVKKGRLITLTISRGPEKVFVPDFANRKVTEIRSDLRSAGLEFGLTALVYHPTLPPDTIIAQDPLSGQRTLQNKKVNLLVSQGPRVSAYVMPNLVGMDLETVRETIKNEPFDLSDDGIRYEQTPDIAKWFRVIGQVPSPGTRMMENDNIRLTVGSSGLEVTNLRIITVTFPIPSALYRDSLTISVWDDITSQTGTPAFYPVQPQLWEQTITQKIPVVGDALVSLCLENEYPEFPLNTSFYSQYFPSN